MASGNAEIEGFPVMGIVAGKVKTHLGGCVFELNKAGGQKTNLAAIVFKSGNKSVSQRPRIQSGNTHKARWPLNSVHF